MHTFKWIYMKDSSGSYGEDCCRIDDVQFPAANANYFISGVKVIAEVSGNQVTLSWQGTNPNNSYIIRRDGQQLAIQQETSFTETCAEGSYVYSVVVLNGEQMSAPAFAFVQVGVTDVTENPSNIAIYPNPTDGLLHIILEEPFCYTLYDGFGRQICQGENQKTLNLNALPKGLYYLRITTESKTQVEKVIVR